MGTLKELIEERAGVVRPPETIKPPFGPEIFSGRNGSLREAISLLKEYPDPTTVCTLTSGGTGNHD